jgi:hypothetical protein
VLAKTVTFGCNRVRINTKGLIHVTSGVRPLVRRGACYLSKRLFSPSLDWARPLAHRSLLRLTAKVVIYRQLPKSRRQMLKALSSRVGP